jgi:hypothetical protein
MRVRGRVRGRVRWRGFGTREPAAALAIHHSSPVVELPVAHTICIPHSPAAHRVARYPIRHGSASHLQWYPIRHAPPVREGRNTCGAAPPTDERKPRESVWYDIFGILVALLTWSCVLPYHHTLWGQPPPPEAHHYARTRTCGMRAHHTLDHSLVSRTGRVHTAPTRQICARPRQGRPPRRLWRRPYRIGPTGWTYNMPGVVRHAT